MGTVMGCCGPCGPTVLLCLYGFCSMMRPIEPFLTEFLTGPDKNFTTQQVNRQLYPVWTYSTLLLLLPVLLLTDALRYKPIILLQAASYVASCLLLLLCTTIGWAKLALFIYSMAMAADVAYFSYIYRVVRPARYQRVTSYVRAAMLVGYASGSLLGQLLSSLGGVSLFSLCVLTLVFVSVALLTACLLPMPAVLGSTAGPEQDSDLMSKVIGSLRRLLQDCRECFSSMSVLVYCCWAAAARCGFYQMTAYVQLLWEEQQPHNFTAYNGAVDGVSTLSGAAASVAVGHVTLEWGLWGELVLGGLSFIITAAIFLMSVTRSIWTSYACYFLVKTLYMQLATVCTFQIARLLSRERYALVFGVNYLIGLLLQSALTAIAISLLQLRINTQFLVYASYFAVISLLFTIRGIHTAQRLRCQPADAKPERESRLPESS